MAWMALAWQALAHVTSHGLAWVLARVWVTHMLLVRVLTHMLRPHVLLIHVLLRVRRRSWVPLVVGRHGRHVPHPRVTLVALIVLMLLGLLLERRVPHVRAIVRPREWSVVWSIVWSVECGSMHGFWGHGVVLVEVRVRGIRVWFLL